MVLIILNGRIPTLDNCLRHTKFFAMTSKIKIACFFIFFSAQASFIYSQTNIDQATKETNQSPAEKYQNKLKVEPRLPIITIEQKKLASDTKFFVDKINLAGIEALKPENFSLFIEKYVNKEVSLNELTDLAKEIETEYLKSGVIAACFIPPQEIQKKTITLQIVEAKMGGLDIQEHKYFNKNRLNYYWRLKEGEILYHYKLAQSLKLMNKNPDREVKAALHAGKKPQTSDILLNVDSQFPFHLTYSFDREGPPATGKERQSWGFQHNNLLGIDDIFLGEYSRGKHFNSISQYHSIPISKNGTSLLYGYNYNKSFPKGELESFEIDSRSKNASMLIYQDLFNKENYLGSIHGGFNSKDKTTKLNTGTLNRDRLRILSLGSDLTFKQAQSILDLNLEISQGLNIFGARRKNNLSSRGAENIFTRLNLGGEYKKSLLWGMQANLKLDSQFASTKLTPQEEFALGGMDSIRGYPGGDYLADNACQVKLDLLLPAFFIPESLKIPYDANTLKNNITPLIFWDYGYGRRKGVLSTENKNANLESAGVGFQIRLFNQALIRLAWGFVIGDKRITENGHSEFHLSFRFEDQFSREAKRIKKLREKDNPSGGF